MLTEDLAERLRQLSGRMSATSGPMPKRGDDIFTAGDDYPRSFAQFQGQVPLVTHLRTSIRSALERGKRLDHVLIASGTSGAGKTALMKLIAAEMGVGILELSGKVAADDAKVALRNCRDNDVLALDEVHRLVQGGKAHAEWLLHLLQDGVIMSASGAEKMPDVTVVAATTDAGMLPVTILNRFAIRPVLTPYSLDEASAIASSLATRSGVTLEPAVATAIAKAAGGSARDMRAIIVAYRDSAYDTWADGQPDLDIALQRVGVTPDGLTVQMRSYLTHLALAEGKASLATIAGAMGEPGPLGECETRLISLGYVNIRPGGRQITKAGLARVQQLIED